MAVHVVKLHGYHPPSVNRYARHRGVRIQARNKLHKLLEPWYTPISPCYVPKADGRRRVQIHLTYPHGAKRMDRDNVQKVLLDGLVAAGLINGDSPAWVEVAEPTDERGLYQVTTITLTDLGRDADLKATDLAGGRWDATASGPGRVVLRWFDSAEENPGGEPEPFAFSPAEADALAAFLKKAADDARRR